MAANTVPAKGSITVVSSDSTQSVTIVAANGGRKDLTIYNNSTAYLFLDLTGGTASSTNFSIKLFPDDYYELPRHPDGVYTGLITGRWSATNGNAMITEFAR